IAAQVGMPRGPEVEIRAVAYRVRTGAALSTSTEISVACAAKKSVLHFSASADDNAAWHTYSGDVPVRATKQMQGGRHVHPVRRRGPRLHGPDHRRADQFPRVPGRRLGRAVLPPGRL